MGGGSERGGMSREMRAERKESDQKERSDACTISFLLTQLSATAESCILNRVNMDDSPANL
jgi:hypothetical protein